MFSYRFKQFIQFANAAKVISQTLVEKQTAEPCETMEMWELFFK